MPKVPPAHLAARRSQIVAAAATLFAQHGFAGTPMSAIIAASGMSAGAVYHYFPAKTDLMAAVGTQVYEAYVTPLRPLLEADPLPPPLDAIRLIASVLSDVHRDAHHGGVDYTRLGILMWGEALREPALHDQVVAVQRSLRDSLTGLVRRWQAQGDLAAGADPSQVAVALYSLMPGFTLQLNMLEGATPAALAAGLEALAGAIAANRVAG